MSPRRPSSFRVLIPHRKIQIKNRQLAAKISKHYQNKNWMILGLMNGSLYFLGDLLRHLPSETPVETWKISSYQGTRSTGKIVGIPQSAPSLKNRHVLIVDDILDTGKTLSAVRDSVLQFGALSVKIVVLLSKKVPRTDPIKANWVGFPIPPLFVVGYGLDLNGQFRGLPDIVEVL